MTVALNNRSWSKTDFTGTNGYGYNQPKSPDAASVPAFPDGIFNDMLAELDIVKVPGAVSTTAVLIGTGVKAFTLAAAVTLRAGTYRAYSAADTTKWMIGTLAADLVAGTALNLTVVLTGGAGTPADWIITRVTDSGRIPFSAKTGAYTVVAADLGGLISASGTWTLSLTSAATLGHGFYFMAANTGTGVITIDPSGAETVDGATTVALQAGQRVTLLSDGTNWIITNVSGRGLVVGGGPVRRVSRRMTTHGRDASSLFLAPDYVTVGTTPDRLLYVPSTDKVWCTNVGSTNISVVDPHTFLVVATLSMANVPARGMCYNPIDDTVWIGTTAGTVEVWSAASLTRTAIITAGGGSNSIQGIAISPWDNKAWIFNEGGVRCYIRNATTQAAITDIAVSNTPRDCAIDPLRRRVWYAGTGSDYGYVDIAANTNTSKVAPGAALHPYQVQIDVARARVYFSCGNGNLIEYDLQADTAADKGAVFQNNASLLLDPWGRLLNIGQTDPCQINLVTPEGGGTYAMYSWANFFGGTKSSRGGLIWVPSTEHFYAVISDEAQVARF